MAAILFRSSCTPQLFANLGLRSSVPPMCVVPNRAKSKPAQRQKKERKETMRDVMKRIELEKHVMAATVNVFRKGEPMDPEMLNPARKRQPVQLTEEQKEQRVLLTKQWTRYRAAEHKKDLIILQGLMNSRKKALHELKKVSVPLYEQALELRTDLFPFEQVGPTDTPSVPDYAPPELQEE